MRGEQEQNSLNFVKSKILNLDSYKYYFGLLEEDRIQIEKILCSAKPNINASEFPDFVFDDGFIEHFQITSSQVTRKGAVHKKKEQQFKATVSKEMKIIQQTWSRESDYDKVRSKHWIFNNPKHSYDYLVKSFKNTWIHHIKSLNKYFGSKINSIFLIEYTEFALSMSENVYIDWINGMSQGDMRKQEEFRCYRLSRDKKLLEFVYQYKEKIKYIIFVYQEGFEIIKIENIPFLLKLLPWDFSIYPLVVKQIGSAYNISIPNIISEEGEEND